MASAQLQVVRELIGAIDLTTGSIEERRRRLESAAAAPADDVSLEPVVIPSDGGSLLGEWVSPFSPALPRERVVLYLHGGGYVLGSVKTHRRLVSLLAAAAASPALAVDYRLAPEHPYPAALADAVTAYRWLLGQGVAPHEVIIAGDSAGGGLTIATLLALRDSGDPLPRAAVGISPWADLTLSSSSIESNRAHDLMLSRETLAEMATWYANGADTTAPTMSPVTGDLRGLPPLLLQVGSTEILRDDAARVAATAQAAGVVVRLEVWDDMPHVWHAFAGLLPEADTAIAAVGAWCRAQFEGTHEADAAPAHLPLEERDRV